MCTRTTLLATLLTVIFSIAATRVSIAQETPPPPRSLAIGAHVGLPTGLSLKLEAGGKSYDLLLAWNLQDFFFAHSHVFLVEKALPQRPRLHYYAGPGLVINGRDGQLRTGLSVNAGIYYLLEPFEFFGQITPRLEVVPSTRVGFNAGAGVRIFL